MKLNKPVVDLVQHGKSALFSSLAEGWPTKFGDHVGDTRGVVVSVQHKPGSTSLDHFQLVCSTCSIGIPDSATILH